MRYSKPGGGGDDKLGAPSIWLEGVEDGFGWGCESCDCGCDSIIIMRTSELYNIDLQLGLGQLCL